MCEARLFTKKIATPITLPAILVVLALSAALRAQPPLTGWTLVWSDEFNGASLDTSKWTVDTSVGDAGLAAITSRPENVFVSNGCLNLQAQKESYNGKQYTSSRISTRDKASWRYCRIDIRAKFPIGTGMWPAFRLRPQASPYGRFPAGGEIDWIENYGNNTNIEDNDIMYSSLHYSTTNQATISSFYCVDKHLNEFHTYTMTWDSGFFAFYLDNVMCELHSCFMNYFNCNNWTPDNVAFPKPFDVAFSLMLDLSIGGMYGAPDTGTPLPQQLQVDWVRVYQH